MVSYHFIFISYLKDINHHHLLDFDIFPVDFDLKIWSFISLEQEETWVVVGRSGLMCPRVFQEVGWTVERILAKLDGDLADVLEYWRKLPGNHTLI